MLEKLKYSIYSLFRHSIDLKIEQKANQQSRISVVSTVLHHKESSTHSSSELNPSRIKPLLSKGETELSLTTFPTTLEEKKALSEQFQVGDMIIIHLTGLNKVEIVDPFIVMLQRITKFFGRSDPTERHQGLQE